MKYIKTSLLFLFLFTLQSQVANAALILTLERISDTEGLLTASGEIDIDVTNDRGRLAFTLLESSGASRISILEQNLMLGDDGLVGFRFRNPTQVLLRMAGPFERGDAFSGQIRFSLETGTMLSVGTSQRFFNDVVPGERYGTVEFVASRALPVNEPGVLGLFGLSAVLMLISRRRRA